MRHSPQPKPPTRSGRARLLVIATLASGLLMAGCGGSAPSPTAATNPLTAGSASAPTRTAAADASGSHTAAGRRKAAGGGTAAGRRSHPRTTAKPGGLAFARCMRAHGVSNFPDPQPGGGFSFQANGSVRSSPAFRTAQQACASLMPGGGPLSAGPPASAATMALLRRIAVCMRQHGVPQFPDPLPSVPHGFNPNLGKYSEITNYMGAILLYPTAIDQHSPAFERAVAACHAGFLAGNNAH